MDPETAKQSVTIKTMLEDLDPILWKTLELELGQDKLAVQEALLQRCTGLLELKLLGSGFDGISENTMASLVSSILTERCLNLKSLQILNCPYVSQAHISQLVTSTNCKITQTTVFNLSQSGERDLINATDKNQIELHNVETTDYYRKGNSYKILNNPGSSVVIFNLNISVERLASLTISLNHCRTMSDAIVCMTVNGRPAEQRDDGTFTEKVIMAPRYDFGWESFPVGLKLLKEGLNKITLCLDSSSPGVYWLSDATIEAVFE